ncbi:hypothetical protein SLEP1_g49606 [Rubroshorea leprosula]|uniref:Uncharacterized protein n=1 Tax=Rubroshorea leprosula TaxID=152421 RepID=A0AAV5LXB8_9ROSI|nr:hypothetical protein SLEP1_g49606 [Rubroshorea leprosula]
MMKEKGENKKGKGKWKVLKDDRDRSPLASKGKQL